MDCFICEKHRQGGQAQGGVLVEDDLVYIGHIHALERPTAYRGYLMLEPKRHVPGLGDLTDEEAAAIGRMTNRVARLQRDVLGAEHVYSFVYGDGVPHLHVHLAPRYPGTPTKYWGHRLQRWPEAPKVDPEEMRELITKLRDADPRPEEPDEADSSGRGQAPSPRTATPRPRRIVSRSYGPGEAPDPRATYFDDLSGLRQALLWAVTTRRQLDRWEDVVAETLRCHLYEEHQPSGREIWEAEAERHLTFVAARNLLRAIDVAALLVSVDVVLEETIVSVRDVLEHWDENMPVFNVWPHTIQPPRKSGKRFARRNPERSPYDQIAWNGSDGPLLAPNLPASTVHSMLDRVETETVERNPHLAEYISERPPSPWHGDASGTYRWWPTRPGSNIVSR